MKYDDTGGPGLEASDLLGVEGFQGRENSIKAPEIAVEQGFEVATTSPATINVNGN